MDISSFEQLSNFVEKHHYIEIFFHRIIRVLIIVAGFAFSAKFLRYSISRALDLAHKNSSGDLKSQEREKRLETLIGLLNTTLRISLFGLASLMILREVGIDITPLLTGAGIAGVAVGFGSQSLVKDVISGIFLLVEDQIRLGDFVKINNLSGTVEKMQLRVTALRDFDGTLHIIPNGEIKAVSNLTYEFAEALVHVHIPYDTPLNQVFSSAQNVLNQIKNDQKLNTELLGEPRIVGVTQFEPNYYTFQINAKTKPASRWLVSKELRKSLLLEFEGKRITFLKTNPT